MLIETCLRIWKRIARATLAATVFGAVQWVRFDVWGYQIRPEHATLERPVNLADRICGTPQIIIPA